MFVKDSEFIDLDVACKDIIKRRRLRYASKSSTYQTTFIRIFKQPFSAEPPTPRQKYLYFLVLVSHVPAAAF